MLLGSDDVYNERNFVLTNREMYLYILIYRYIVSLTITVVISLFVYEFHDGKIDGINHQIYQEFIDILIFILYVLVPLIPLSVTLMYQQNVFGKQTEITLDRNAVQLAKRGMGNEIEELLLFGMGTKQLGINATDDEGNTPAILAAGNDDTVTLEILAKHGANFLTQNKKGKTAFQVAMMNRKLAG